MIADPLPRAGPLRIARDVARHSLYVGPAVVAVAWATRDGDGAAAAAIAVAIVVANMLASATMLTWAARQGGSVLMGVALGGFLVRMGLVVAVLLAVRDLVDLPTLAVTVIVTQLGLLFWEARTLGPMLTDALPAAGRVGVEGSG